MLFVFNSRLSSNCSDVTVDFGNLSASSISVRSNVIVSSDGVFLHFIFKLAASAFRSLAVDAHVPVSVPHATETILDFSIDAFQIRSPHERNLGLRTSRL